MRHSFSVLEGVEGNFFQQKLFLKNFCYLNRVNIDCDNTFDFISRTNFRIYARILFSEKFRALP